MSRVKRTYNLPEETVLAVRELSEQYGLAPTQDAVVELAVDELRRHLRSGDVPIGAGEAGQTKPGVIIGSQPRTISTARVRGRILGVVRDPATRMAVRMALRHHLGLDVAARLDGALAE
jgi:hypothetical protein